MLMKATKFCKQKCYFLTFFCPADRPGGTLTDSVLSGSPAFNSLLSSFLLNIILFIYLFMYFSFLFVRTPYAGSNSDLSTRLENCGK